MLVIFPFSHEDLTQSTYVPVIKEETDVFDEYGEVLRVLPVAMYMEKYSKLWLYSHAYATRSCYPECEQDLDNTNYYVIQIKECYFSRPFLLSNSHLVVSWFVLQIWLRYKLMQDIYNLFSQRILRTDGVKWLRRSFQPLKSMIYRTFLLESLLYPQAIRKSSNISCRFIIGGFNYWKKVAHECFIFSVQLSISNLFETYSLLMIGSTYLASKHRCFVGKHIISISLRATS